MGRCAVCGKGAAFECSTCNVATYCSLACQTRDWAGHKSVCKNPAPVRLSGLFGTVHGLQDLFESHVEYTQDLLVATVAKDSDGVDNAVQRLVSNKRDWVSYLEDMDVRDPDQWYKPGPENGGLGDGVFLRHSLAAKGVFDGAEGLNSENNNIELSPDGKAANAILWLDSLDEIVEFWKAEGRKKNDALTSSDVNRAWRSHLDCTVEYARQLLISGGDAHSATYEAAAAACRAQGRLVGAVLESLLQS